MKDACFTVPTPALLARGVDMLDALPMEDRDAKGDLYEYMLGKHAGARTLYRRPLASTPEMDAALEAHRNAAVAPDNEVSHLGDFALHLPPAAVAGLLGRLHGRKHLATGNNDPPAVAALAEWEGVQPYAELEQEGVRLMLCHYAFRT